MHHHHPPTPTMERNLNITRQSFLRLRRRCHHCRRWGQCHWQLGSCQWAAFISGWWMIPSLSLPIRGLQLKGIFFPVLVMHLGMAMASSKKKPLIVSTWFSNTMWGASLWSHNCWSGCHSLVFAFLAGALMVLHTNNNLSIERVSNPVVRLTCCCYQYGTYRYGKFHEFCYGPYTYRGGTTGKALWLLQPCISFRWSRVV